MIRTTQGADERRTLIEWRISGRTNDWHEPSHSYSGLELPSQFQPLKERMATAGAAASARAAKTATSFIIEWWVRVERRDWSETGIGSAE